MSLPTPYFDDGAGIQIYLGDCRDILPHLPKVDLVLTDPPYGIKVDSVMHKISGTQYGHAAAPKGTYPDTDWDTHPPSQDLLEQIIALASFSIIFGGHYFPLGPARCILVWDKLNGSNCFADCELAWTNLDKPARIKRHMWNGMLRENDELRYGHPTQKPNELIKWCILTSETSGTILDPFAGSCTTAVAAKALGRKCICIEKDERWLQIAVRRLAQTVLPL